MESLASFWWLSYIPFNIPFKKCTSFPLVFPWTFWFLPCLGSWKRWHRFVYMCLLQQQSDLDVALVWDRWVIGYLHLQGFKDPPAVLHSVCSDFYSQYCWPSPPLPPSLVPLWGLGFPPACRPVGELLEVCKNGWTGPGQWGTGADSELLMELAGRAGPDDPSQGQEAWRAPWPSLWFQDSVL